MFKKKKDKSTLTRGHILRLYPTADQAKVLNRFAGITRACHNLLLEREQKEYESTGKYPGLSWFTGQCAAMKREKGLEWLKTAPAQALQCAAKELDLTFEAFFGYKAGKTGMKRGLPKFHKRGHNDSFRIPQGGFARVGCKHPAGFIIDQSGNKIFVPKLGWVSYRNGGMDISVYKGWNKGVPKAAVFKKKAGKWFATVFVEYAGKMPEIKKGICPSLRH